MEERLTLLISYGNAKVMDSNMFDNLLGGTEVPISFLYYFDLLLKLLVSSVVSVIFSRQASSVRISWTMYIFQSNIKTIFMQRSIICQSFSSSSYKISTSVFLCVSSVVSRSCVVRV